ncbi:MAG: hypothetical protein AMXMBFR77_27270 [Phycisphaerales bacterium]
MFIESRRELPAKASTFGLVMAYTPGGSGMVCGRDRGSDGGESGGGGVRRPRGYGACTAPHRACDYCWERLW